MTKILVIEDEKAVIENIVELLETENYLVFAAENGQIGVEKALEILPDLIICDIMMPIMDGYAVLKELYANPMTSDIPFIFLSAKSEYTDRIMGMNEGADDFLTKPFTPQQLFDTIETRLSKHSKIKEPIKAILDKFKQDIAVIIPHELRTPLNGIKMTVQLLQSSFSEMDQDDIDNFLSIILQSSNRIESLINKFELYIELEKLELGDDSLLKDIAVPVNESNVLLSEIIKNVAGANNRLEDVSSFISDVSLPICHKHFVNLATELIENAFKFSSLGNKIKITLDEQKDGYHFSVFNEGIGMDKDNNRYLGNIQIGRKQFEQQGLGLGLAIVKKIIKINNLHDNIDCRANQFFKYEVVFPKK